VKRLIPASLRFTILTLGPGTAPKERCRRVVTNPFLPVKFLRKRKREKTRALPFPDEWDDLLREHFSIYSLLDDSDRRELQSHVMVFLDEKQFEGCAGLELTDEIRVTIAAQACVLLLHRETDYFPSMTSIFVYPSLFVIDAEEQDETGIVSTYEDELSGESWDLGPVVLSWEDALIGARGEDRGYNTVIHEFAHQLDLENGAVDGVPKLDGVEGYDAWERAFTAAYEKLEKKIRADRDSAVDEYALEGPDEFFAVVTEHFFQTPAELRAEFPAVYDELKAYFKQDPAAWNVND